MVGGARLAALIETIYAEADGNNAVTLSLGAALAATATLLLAL